MLQVINRRPGDKLKWFAENRKLVKISPYFQLWSFSLSTNSSVQFFFLFVVAVTCNCFLAQKHTNINLDTDEQMSIW